ncbi:MAG: efflux RND transporter periplasmic adaptor subunit [Anaerolineae bacterium]|jgi:HlyD family secretion protein
MKRGIRLIIAGIFLILAAGGGYLAYDRYVAVQAQEPEEPTMETAMVSEGDIVLTADGSGELIPADELELSFRTSGRLAEVRVETGDEVLEGDLLASLETDSLEREVTEADVELQIAQLELADVREGPSEPEVADAEASLRDAQAQLTLAYDAYGDTTDSMKDDAVDSAKENFDYWVGYYQGQKDLYEREKISQADHDWAMAAMMKAEDEWQRAINDAEAEQVQAWKSVEQAQNGVAQAEADLELLMSEPQTDTLVAAELAVDSALLAREEAQADLEAARLYAPFSGTVMEVTAEPGDQVGMTTAILTLADMEEPLLRFWLEESDMGNVAMGSQVNVVFEALPDHTFTGKVTGVDPVLVTVSGSTAVQAQARLNLGDQGLTLLSGMTADVEVISAETRGALLVPVEALNETPEGGYIVYVLQADGEVEERQVEVGLTDAVNAEILSGLGLGGTLSIDG